MPPVPSWRTKASDGKIYCAPYESHEVTLSIDPAKLGVVSMAPFDGKVQPLRLVTWCGGLERHVPSKWLVFMVVIWRVWSS